MLLITDQQNRPRLVDDICHETCDPIWSQGDTRTMKAWAVVMMIETEPARGGKSTDCLYLSRSTDSTSILK